MQAPKTATETDALDPAVAYDLHRIAGAYQPKTMTGPDAVRLAAYLVAAGFEESDALAFTWPVTSRNILREVGRVGRGPSIETWEDLGNVHATQLEAARASGDALRIDQLARMVVLSETLAEAEK